MRALAPLRDPAAADPPTAECSRKVRTRLTSALGTPYFRAVSPNERGGATAFFEIVNRRGILQLTTHARLQINRLRVTHSNTLERSRNRSRYPTAPPSDDSSEVPRVGMGRLHPPSGFQHVGLEERRQHLRHSSIAHALEAPGTSFRDRCGGNGSVPTPPPPVYLQKSGRIPGRSEDSSGDDGRHQAPSSQRVRPRSRAPSISKHNAPFRVRLPPPPPATYLPS
jgi:hypothetical protein